MKRFLLLFLAAASVVIVSCSKDEGIAETLTTTTLAKEWFVKVQGPTGTSNYSLFSTRTLTLVSVVDTFGNQQGRLLKDTITLDDHNQFSPTLRAHVKIDVASRTFGAGQYKNWNNPADSVILKEGKILKDAGRSKSGAVVDSIYIKYAFKSDPSIDYLMKGHARTGLIADEY